MAARTTRAAATRSFAKPTRPIVTLKFELPPMSSAKAYKQAAEYAEKLTELVGEETDSAWTGRLRSVSVVN